MKLEQYIKNLQKIAETNPDLDVIYTTDECNGYIPVHYTPSLGFYDKSDGGFDQGSNVVNAVCIN